MITSISRLLLRTNKSTTKLPLRYIGEGIQVVYTKHGRDQLEFIKTIQPSSDTDWTSIKNKVLDIPGSINQINFDGVILKYLVKNKRLDVALSYANHLKKSGELNIGSINGILGLCYELGTKNQLTDEMKSFILETYKYLYDKYKVLDATTSQYLLHALCVIDEWEKAIKVLDDIVLDKPSHSSYSVIIATLFKLNKKKEALKMVERSINEQRPLLHKAYEQWIDYVLRKYKEKKTKIEHLEAILEHISKNFVVIPELTAVKMNETFSSLGWKVNFTKIGKQSGQCMTCKEPLDLLKLCEAEFSLLQKNVKEKVIIGSDLFLKTSPKELQRFLDFVDNTAPYDIVIDGLNVAFAAKSGMNHDRSQLLINVVQQFKDRNMKILLLGRKHMLKWPKITYMLGTTINFFTDNISQDDPFFITAAILSGPHTDIVSKDQLRGHRFAMKDEVLRSLFRRWQWQHQWMVFGGWGGQPIIRPKDVHCWTYASPKDFHDGRFCATRIQRLPATFTRSSVFRCAVATQELYCSNGYLFNELCSPLPITPCAQKNKSVWHVPFEREDVDTAGQVRDGTPDWASWLCLVPPR